MRRTFSIGRLFVTTATQAGGAPFVDRGVTSEPDGRRGHALVFVGPWKLRRGRSGRWRTEDTAQGLAVGWWQPVASGDSQHGEHGA